MPDRKPNPLVVPPSGGQRLLVIGQETTVKLSAADPGRSAYVFEAGSPPGSSVPPHVHQHEDELLRVLEGEFDIFLDGKNYKAGVGAVINFPRLVAHGFSNTAHRPARAMFTVTPGENFDRFFQELSKLPADQPPDPAKVAEIFSRWGLTILGAPPAP
jgi:quercetin dioxygenase-like cupin family protein